MRPTVGITVVALAASLLGAVASPATADSRTFHDGTATRSSMDIHRVRVVNERRLTVRVVVDDLQRRAGQGGVTVWLDTNGGRRGPEFGIGSGLWESDWHIGRASGWRFVGRGPLACPIGQRLLFKRDTIVFTTGRACLGAYRKVRVSVTTSAGRWGRTVDHSPRRHAFHRWVRRS